MSEEGQRVDHMSHEGSKTVTSAAAFNLRDGRRTKADIGRKNGPRTNTYSQNMYTMNQSAAASKSFTSKR